MQINKGIKHYDLAACELWHAYNTNKTATDVFL